MFRKSVYLLKLLAGGYLILVGGLLLQKMWEEKPGNMTVMCVVAAVFILVGAGTVFWLLSGFLKIKKKRNAAEIMADEDDTGTEQETPRLLRDPATFRTAPMPDPEMLADRRLSERERNVRSLRRNNEDEK